MTTRRSWPRFAAYTGCYSKGAAKGGVVDSACLTNASFKITVAFGKLDSRGGCITTGDGVARDLDTAAFASANSGLVGFGISKCDAVKQKLVGKYVAGIAACSAKAPGTVDSICTGKVQTKFLAAVGMADLPMANTSNPTLGAVFCVGPTAAGPVNSVLGLPGPGRITIKGAASGHP